MKSGQLYPADKSLSSKHNLLVVQSKSRTRQFYPLDKVIQPLYNRAQMEQLLFNLHGLMLTEIYFKGVQTQDDDHGSLSFDLAT